MYTLPILELLQDSFDPPLTRERLARLKIELNVRFSQEYEDFLLQFNGGYFHRPVMYYVPNTDRWTEGMSVEVFYGEPADSRLGPPLSWHAETLRGRIPGDCLSIAHCGGVDMILLGIDFSNEDFGKVWFWDGTEEGEGNNIYWLANSFSEFLAMLQYDTYYEYEEQETLPIFQFIERGNLRRVEQFVSEGGDIESRNALGHTLLAAAARHSWPKIVRLLLERGADVSARDEQGRTPLHHAATHSIDSIKLLLSHGADATGRDRDGNGVLGQWSYRGDQILRAHGAR